VRSSDIMQTAAVGLCAAVFLTGCRRSEEETIVQEPEASVRKYVAFCCDLESPYTEAVGFGPSKGIFSRDMLKVLANYPGVPYTWMILRDKDALVINYYAKEIHPVRKDIDEPALHVHYKWYIQDRPTDMTSWKIEARRKAWVRGALEQYKRLELPLPRTFRPGGGDSQENLWYLSDFEVLYDEVGIRNYLMGPRVFTAIEGSTGHQALGKGMWRIDGGRTLTVLRTSVSLEREENQMYEALDERLSAASYALITCHDYNPVVPGNLEKMILYIRKTHPGVKFVTISTIADLIRDGKIANTL